MMKSKRAVYLDYAATTPTDPRVLEAMLPYFSEVFGNSHSAHRFGQQAEAAVELARASIARLLNCKPSEIIFTSCGSESDNLALRGTGLTRRQAGHGQRILTSTIEHSAVSRTAEQMATWMGFDWQAIPVDAQGQVSAQTLAEMCQAGANLVSIMYANNEVGTVQAIPELAKVAHVHGAVFHTDAVQAVGQLPLDVQALGVDMLSLAAHKFYGPKGVGLLYVREGIALVPSQSGGSHEQGRRAGTLSTPLIVGMAKALELAFSEYDSRRVHAIQLRNQLIERVLERVPDVRLTGHPSERLASHASFVFEGVDANKLLIHLDMRGVAASSASACKTGNPEPSEVLLALGYSRAEALSSLRLTVGYQTTEADIDYAVEALVESVAAVRSLQKVLTA